MVFASLASGETSDQAERIPTWTPCIADPVSFDCHDCEIGWRPCKLRADDGLRHWRAAQYSRHSGLLSANEERDNEIESAVVRLLLSHGVSVSSRLLLEYLPRETLAGITAIELENLLRKSPRFVESSPRMFKLSQFPGDGNGAPSFKPLPMSSGSHLAWLVESYPTLGVSKQTRLLKEFGGLSLLASFDTSQAARTALDQIVQESLETVMSRRRWTVQTVHRYAVGPETVPTGAMLTDDDTSVTSRLLSSVSASELLTKMSPAQASDVVPKVRETLLLGNIRLVVHQARIRSRGGFLNFTDLVQVGTVGLMAAMERFDPFRGFQFSTYATYWIRQAISREQANLDRSIRIPVHVIEELNSLLQRRTELEFDLNRIPTNVELANELSLGLGRVEFLLQLARPLGSLDLLMQDGASAAEEDSRLHAMADSGEQVDLSNWIARDAVEKVLLSLSAREAQVLRLRFGIGGGDSQTLEQVGQAFGVTRERIRQIEAKALKKLRRPKNARRLRDLW